jgi:hypothetical protein
VLPSVKLIRGEGTRDDDVTTYPVACDGIRTWMSGPNGVNWAANAHALVAPAVEYFLSRMIEASGLVFFEDYYNSCMDLETASSRITEAQPGTFGICV